MSLSNGILSSSKLPNMPSFRRKKVRNSNLNSGSGVVPPKLLEESMVPKFYHDAIAMCGATSLSQGPDTTLVYNLMMTSQLSKDVLGNIWSLVNRSKPGQLTRQEFYACLALIALAQKGESLSGLSDVSALPIPFLQSFTINTSRSTLDLKPTFVVSPGTSRSVGLEKTPKFTMRTSFQSPRNDSNGGSIDPNPTNGGHIIGKTGDLFASINEESSGQNFFDSLGKGFKQHSSDSSLQIFSGLNNSQQISYHIFFWKKCLDAALAEFVQAEDLLLHSDLEHTIEVVVTRRGVQYLQCLNAIFALAERINTSLEQAVEFTGRQELLDRHIVITAKWIALQKITLNRVVLPSLRTTFSSINSNNTFCAVCLQPTAISDQIEFVGCYYHVSCANFFINNVDSLLPKLPQLAP